jgi:AcrR family transcriptional regulator
VSEQVQRSPERARRLPRAVRERQILDAAVHVFSRHGYHSASMDEISDVAGVSKPMIYTYLGSKEDLFGQCIRREATRLLEAVQDGVHPELAPDMQLWYGLRSFYRFVAEYHESWTVLHRQALTVGGAFAAEITAMRARAIELVAALVVSAGTRKGLGQQAEFSGEGLAAALVGAAESLADWWLDHTDVTDGVLASWLMNLVWLGFNDMVEGAVWKPSESQPAGG